MKLIGFLLFILYVVSVDASKKDAIPPAMGQGSSLAYPLYSKLLFGWDQQDPNNNISYEQTSSSAGINSLIGPQSQRMGFWAGAELLPTALQTNTSLVNERMLRWFPSALISLIPYANYKSLNVSQLKMTPMTFAQIWIGTISRWNDPILVSTNPALQSVDQPIFLVTPSAPSGTFSIFQRSLMNILPPGQWPYPVRTDGTWSPEHLAVLGNRVIYSPVGNPAAFASVFETPTLLALFPRVSSWSWVSWFRPLVLFRNPIE